MREVSGKYDSDASKNSCKTGLRRLLNLKQRERIKSLNPSNPMNTQREYWRMVNRFTVRLAKFLHIPDWAAVFVIWTAWIAVVIIIAMLWG